MLTVYSKNNCPECEKVFALLDSKCVLYAVVKVDQVPEARTFLIEGGHRSVPQIYLAQGAHLYVGDYKAIKNFTDKQFEALKQHLK